MASYTVTRIGPPSNPAQQDDAPEAAETPFEVLAGWPSEARDAIDEGDGDSEDLDKILAVVLEHIAAAVQTLSPVRRNAPRRSCAKPGISNGKIASVLRQQREAREARAVESAALAGRLDRMAGQSPR